MFQVTLPYNFSPFILTSWKIWLRDLKTYTTVNHAHCNLKQECAPDQRVPSSQYYSSTAHRSESSSQESQCKAWKKNNGLIKLLISSFSIAITETAVERIHAESKERGLHEHSQVENI